MPFPIKTSSKKVLINYWTVHGEGGKRTLWFGGEFNCTWGEPAIGYYLDDDPAAIDQHTDWLVWAGVDAVLFDWTNNCGSNNLGVERGTYAFCDRQAVRKRAGKPFVRYAVHTGQCMGTGPGCSIPEGPLMPQKVDQVYNDLLVKRDPDLYFKHEGKPLVCVGFLPQCEAIVRAKFAKEKRFTVRFLTIFNNGKDVWGWENSARDWRSPPVSVSKGKPECATVTSAVRDGTWKSSGTVPNNGGATFRTQFEAVIKKRPAVVFVQSWNQWNTNDTSKCRAGGTAGGENWDAGRTTDIEPMKGGHGDMYLRLLREMVIKFKAP